MTKNNIIDDILLEIDLNESYIINEPINNYIIIDSEEYKHLSFINYDVFADFIKLNIVNKNNYYTFILTKNSYSIIYSFYSIKKVIYYIYNYHTIKLNN